MATYDGSPLDDSYAGTDDADIIHGNDGNDQLQGRAGTDTIHGDGGNDTLDGGADGDTLLGGAGDDIYYVQTNGDRAVELADEGIDTVYSSIAFSLEANVENLYLIDAARVGFGNAGANILEGNDEGNFLDGQAGDDSLNGHGGDDTLDGQAGADSMYGHSGNDNYYLENAGDRVFENADEGFDFAITTVSYDFADQSIERISLQGSADLTVIGNDLVNIIDSNSGASILSGMGGNDTYIIRAAGGQVIEADGGGFDRIQSAVSFDLAGQFAEDLWLWGSGNLSAYGNDLANNLTGNEYDNWLEGRGGADTMWGNYGDDTYVIDRADTIVEFAGLGTDTVMAGFNYRLLVNFENLTLTGIGNINGVGNAAANILTGNSGINELKGGAGDDIYYVQNSTDRAFERVGEGTDSVFSSVAFSIAGQFVENLTLTGSANVGASGNSLANILQGNDGNNNIRGMDGNDRLNGGLGGDLLIGGAGADRYYFDTTLGASNIDSIADFNILDDVIYLDRAIFTAIAANGELGTTAFGIAGTASSSGASIIYNRATGTLTYDADGDGAGVIFATLAKGLALTHGDFVAYS